VFGKSIFRSYSNLINLISRITDPLLIVVAAIVAYGIKFQSLGLDMPKDYRILVGFAFLCTLVIFPLFNVYSSWRGLSLFRLAKTVLLSWFSVVTLMIVILFSLKISYEYSRVWLVLWAIMGLTFILLMRIYIYLFLQYQRRKGKNLRYIVIVGAGDLGKKVLSQVKDSPWTGYKVRALFDDNESLIGNKIDDIEVVGAINKIESFLSNNHVDEVWIALPLRAELRMKELLHDLRHHTVNMKLIPDIFGFTLLYHSMTEIAGLPAVNLSVSPMDGSNRIVKALEDRFIACIILMLTSPLLLLISIVIKLTSSGPIFYKQERVSWNGKKFNMYKFRSMQLDQDSGDIVWGNANNKKVTKVGSFLRKSSLDELPQLINVLLGDMSIVGPRPERSEFVEKFKEEIPGYMQKHMVKAGITGWAQVNGWRGDTCLKTRIEHDLYYIENWSLWFDLKFISLTVLKGFLNKNAY